MRGYHDYDSDEEADVGHADVVAHNTLSRLEESVSSWCECGNCRMMETDLECYCCQESTVICDLLMDGEDLMCVTELPIFKRTIEEREVIELQESGMREVRRDADGQFKPESCRFIAYTTFLQMCSLRLCGKGRRYVIPSCVVSRIRDLYPAPDGKYTDFVPGDINSEI